MQHLMLASKIIVCRFCLGKASCNHRKLVESQEFELEDSKFRGFLLLHTGYDRAVKENRNLHDMLQELKGNIRVFCRVRPAFIAEAKCSIDYIGNDGTLILLDPLKSQSLRKSFHFNKVFGPNATQGGHAKMLMLAHVSPEVESYGETVSTLKFAQRVSTVVLGAAHVNKEGSEIRELREQVDALRKELASKEREKALCLHKMKENTSILEASKQNEPTPPHLRQRGLNLENGDILNNTIGNYLDERKLLIKSPLPRPKLSTEDSVARLRRLSLESSRHDKNQRKTKNFESDQQRPQIEEQLKEGAHEEAKANAIIKSFSPVNETEGLPTCSPSISDSPSVNQLKVPGNIFRQLDEVVTPDTQKIKLSSSSTLTSTKGLRFRRLLLTIQKFINRAEKRNYQWSFVMPATKIDRDADIIGKSPATAESRFVRRQSLTNVQPIEIKASRRISLGGKSVESYE